MILQDDAEIQEHTEDSDDVDEKDIFDVIRDK